MYVPSDFRAPPYRRRRAQNWLIIGFLYSFFYMTRYNFTAIAPTLQEVFGWTKMDLGLFETLLPLVYGLSVIINGPIADKIGGRKAFLIGAAGVVFFNIAFGLSYMLVGTPSVWQDGEIVQQAVLNFGLSKGTVLWGLAILWATNGYFQSFGALSIIKINAQWFHVGERGTFSAIFGILIRFGLVLAFSLTPMLVKLFGWSAGFLIPAALVFIVFLLTIFFVADTPDEAGYPGLDTGDGSGAAVEKLPSLQVIKQVVSSKALWMIGSASMMIGFVRRSVVDAWWPVYYKEYYGITGDDAIFQSTGWLIAILGIAGGFAFGMTSDRVFGGRRGPVCTIGFLGMATMLGIWAFSDAQAMGPIAALMCLIGVSFFVNGTHGMLGGAATMDFGGRQAAATAAGMIDGMQYLAGALVGVGCGYITEHYDWQVWKLWPVPFAIVGAIIMARLWNVLPKGRSAH